MTASFWSLGSFGISQAVRLGSNLVLARLLFPEAFGLMALVNVLQQGVQMVSDLGIAPSIIQSAEGEREEFLDTAWLLQVGRGLVLAVGLWLAAGPFAAFYEQPLLADLVRVSSFAILLSGLNAPAVFLLRRRLRLRALALWELSGQAVAVGVMVVWAALEPSVWALVAGNVAGAGVRMAASHVALPGPRPSLRLDRGSAWRIVHFGRWIFLSTLVTFFAAQIDRLLLGKLIAIERVGIYSIAYGLYEVLPKAVNRLSGQVLFPAFSRRFRGESGWAQLGVTEIRVVTILSVQLAALALWAISEELIAFLYDPRYRDAGRMLGILAIGLFPMAVNDSYGALFLGHGRPQLTLVLASSSLALKTSASLLGFHWGGETGFLLGLALTGWVHYGVVAHTARRESLWQPAVDLPFLALPALLPALVYLA